MKRPRSRSVTKLRHDPWVRKIVSRAWKRVQRLDVEGHHLDFGCIVVDETMRALKEKERAK